MIEPHILSYFNLDEASMLEVSFSNFAETHSYFRVDSELYYDLMNKLKKNTTYNSTKNKLYLLPNSTTSLLRVKSILKEEKNYLTGDLENSDLLITHDNLEYCQGRYDTDLIKNSRYSFLRPQYAILHKKTIYLNANNWKNRYKLKNFLNVSSDHMNYLDSVFLVKSQILKIIYTIENKNIGIIHVDDIQSTNKNLILSEELAENIIAMLNNNDKDNLNILAKLLPNVVIDNPYYMWQILKKKPKLLYIFRRDKDVTKWINKNNLQELYDLDTEDFIIKSCEENTMNNKIFSILEKENRKLISISNGKLYNVKFFLKDEYKKYTQN